MHAYGSISATTELGRRSDQEDRFLFFDVKTSDHNGTFIAVMDGHNDDTTAGHCVKRIKDIFERSLQFNTLIGAVFEDVVQKLHHETRFHQSGTTLSMVYIDHNRDCATVAFLGDSPVLTINNKNRVHVCNGHNVNTHAAEIKAVISRGAEILGKYMFSPRSGHYGLQLTRALGDNALDDVLGRTPEIYHIDFPRVVLVASDGVFNSNISFSGRCSGVSLKKLLLSGASADEVLLWAQKYHMRDNATAVLWYAAK
jgi:serine/threonine protein phosphatase PrpC